jgi:hypothetical protein
MFYEAREKRTEEEPKLLERKCSLHSLCRSAEERFRRVEKITVL